MDNNESLIILHWLLDCNLFEGRDNAFSYFYPQWWA